MKLSSFSHDKYKFFLTFSNGQQAVVDLKPLLGEYLSEQALDSARVDPEWGCLEFSDGSVDIDPSTLYSYAFRSLVSG